MMTRWAGVWGQDLGYWAMLCAGPRRLGLATGVLGYVLWAGYRATGHAVLHSLAGQTMPEPPAAYSQGDPCFLTLCPETLSHLFRETGKSGSSRRTKLVIEAATSDSRRQGRFSFSTPAGGGLHPGLPDSLPH